MSRYDDYLDDMDGAEVTEFGGADGGVPPQLAVFLADLRELGQGEAPPPAGELADLLGGAVPLRPRRAGRRIVRRGAAIVAAAMVALWLAAANHTLPAPAERVVSHVVDVLTPFHISGVPEPPAPHSNIPVAPVAPAGRPSPRPSDDSPADDGTRGVPGGGEDSGAEDSAASTAGGGGDGAGDGSGDGGASPAAGGAGSGDGGGSGGDGGTAPSQSVANESAAPEAGDGAQREGNRDN